MAVKCRNAMTIYLKKYGKAKFRRTKKLTDEEKRHRVNIESIENNTASIAVMVYKIGLYRLQNGLMTKKREKEFRENCKEFQPHLFKDYEVDWTTKMKWKRYGRFYIR